MKCWIKVSWGDFTRGCNNLVEGISRKLLGDGQRNFSLIRLRRFSCPRQSISYWGRFSDLVRSRSRKMAPAWLYELDINKSVKYTVFIPEIRFIPLNCSVTRSHNRLRPPCHLRCDANCKWNALGQRASPDIFPRTSSVLVLSVKEELSTTIPLSRLYLTWLVHNQLAIEMFTFTCYRSVYLGSERVPLYREAEEDRSNPLAPGSLSCRASPSEFHNSSLRIKITDSMVIGLLFINVLCPFIGRDGAPLDEYFWHTSRQG